MSSAMMKSHYQRGQKILKDDLKKKWILCYALNSEIFSLYLDLFKNDNGNCHFFSNLRFLRFLHNFFSSKGREKCQAAFSALFWHLDQISWEWIISSFFFFISNKSMQHRHYMLNYNFLKIYSLLICTLFKKVSKFLLILTK